MRGPLAVLLVLSACWDVSSVFALHNRTRCSNPVPGTYWVYFGYDITELDLLPLDPNAPGPEGMKKQILSVTCDSPRVKSHHGARYTYSNQIRTVMDISPEGCSTHSSEYGSTNEVSNKFSLNVGFEANYLSKFSFSASSSYKKMSKTFKDKRRFISEISCTYSHLKVNLERSRQLQLNPKAQRLVDMIHEPLNPTTYRDQPQWTLIRNFGTHYFDEAILGGKYQLTYEIDPFFLYEFDKQDLDAAMSAKLKIARGQNRTEWETQAENFLSSKVLSEKYEHYYGGKSALESGRDWHMSTYDYPWILSGNVKPIYDLIHDESKKLWVKQAVEQYVLRRFVDNAEEQNLDNNPEVTRLVYKLQLSDKMLTLEEVERLRRLLA